MYKCEFCGVEFSTQKEINHHLKKYHKNDIFIQKARKIHGNKYDYSKVEYVNNNTKVCITCPIHGEFEQTPSHHIQGMNCPKCKGGIKYTQEEFIEKSKETHGDKYDYSKVEYKGANIKVCLICSKHGEFEQTPHNHIRGQGCPKCNSSNKKTFEEFINLSKQKHGNIYEYFKNEYVNITTKIPILCKKHGIYYQIPRYHIKGCGCPKCKKENEIKQLQENFILQSNHIHNNKYDYSKVEYEKSSKKVIIKCPIHGEFEQTPFSHLQGCGCPKCNHSKLELEILNNFTELIYQKKFNWLKFKGNLSLDFYSSKFNLGIECQGIQHFYIREESIFNKGDYLTYRLYIDQLKYQQCKEHGIEIIYYFPEEFLKYNIEFYKDKKCFHNIEDIKEYIEKHV